MESWLVTLISSVIPLAVSLLTAVVGLIVTALKYKKQKYEIAMMEEENKFLAAQKELLTPEQIATLKEVIERISK